MKMKNFQCKQKYSKKEIFVFGFYRIFLITKEILKAKMAKKNEFLEYSS